MALANVTVQGDKELAAIFESLSRPSHARTVVRPGIRSSGAHLRKIAKKNAPRDTGHLRRHMRSVVRTTSKGDVYAAIGAEDKKMPDGKNPARYAHLTENDVRPHTISGGVAFDGDNGLVVSPSVQHPGSTGKKWMKRSFAQGFNEARRILLSKTLESYFKFVEKRRKAGKSI